jgi:Lon protease-like protein
MSEIKEKMSFSDLDKILKNLKTLFKRQGYVINWKDLQKQSLDQTINTLSMASPFSLEEKQILLEATNLNKRREKLEEILHTYILDKFSNTTIQ